MKYDWDDTPDWLKGGFLLLAGCVFAFLWGCFVGWLIVNTGH